jgi:hypothetical protein
MSQELTQRLRERTWGRTGWKACKFTTLPPSVRRFSTKYWSEISYTYRPPMPVVGNFRFAVLLYLDSRSDSTVLLSCTANITRCQYIRQYSFAMPYCQYHTLPVDQTVKFCFAVLSSVKRLGEWSTGRRKSLPTVVFSRHFFEDNKEKPGDICEDMSRLSVELSIYGILCRLTELSLYQTFRWVIARKLRHEHLKMDNVQTVDSYIGG